VVSWPETRHGPARPARTIRILGPWRCGLTGPVGDTFPPLQLKSINGEPVVIPDPAGAFVHLQLRRFAGCPISNLHLRSIAQRHDEIESAGIREVVVFHSTAAELLEYQDAMPFLVLADPARDLYDRFGAERGARSILSPGAWRAVAAAQARAIRRAVSERRQPLPMRPNGGNLGLPADFLITSAGRILAVKYGQHAYDQWSVDELLAHALPEPGQPLLRSIK
jgi:hypothetical protein